MATAPLLRPEEVAEVLRVKVSQVYTLMRSGQLKALKIGHRGVWRVHEDDLQAYITDLRSEAEQRGTEDLESADFGVED